MAPYPRLRSPGFSCTCVSLAMDSTCWRSLSLRHTDTHSYSLLPSLFDFAVSLAVIKVQQAASSLFPQRPSLLHLLFLLITAGGWRWSGWTLRRGLLCEGCCVDWAVSVITLVRSLCLCGSETSHFTCRICFVPCVCLRCTFTVSSAHEFKGKANA